MSSEWELSAISSGAHRVINTLTAMQQDYSPLCCPNVKVESACEKRTHQVKKNEAKGRSVTVISGSNEGPFKGGTDEDLC